jgi:hypothetical protein
LSWTSKNAGRLFGILALAGSTAALSETIVVKSTGPSARNYAPGKSIPDNSVLALKAGDSVTILDGRGTRILKGPGSFNTTAATATGSSFTALLRNTGTRQVRTGAVRGLGGGAPMSRPNNVWLIDASKSGTVCVAGTEAASLWFPARPSGANYTLTRLSDNKATPLSLRPAQSVKVWPVADMPITNGAQYRIGGDGLSSPVALRVVKLGPNPQGLEATASALIKAGCNAQLDLLIETVSAPGGESSGG